MNLHDLDSATLQPSAELDALIAEKWMGWRRGPNIGGRHRCWHGADAVGVYRVSEWSPSTNPAHAGEARRKARSSKIVHAHNGCRCVINEGEGATTVGYRETNGDKGKAEALVTCRATIAALQAAQAEGGER